MGVVPLESLHKAYFMVGREMALAISDPVVFEDWEAVLKAEVPPDYQRQYREAIVKFRY